MATKYDVFAQIIEKAPCKVKDLGFASPVYSHIGRLKSDGWITEKANSIVPVKNSKTKSIFSVIKYCLNHGLDYNVFLTGSMKKVLKSLPGSVPDLRPERLKGNKEIISALNYLEQHQFILRYSKRPARGRLLHHCLLDDLASLHGFELRLKDPGKADLLSKVLKIKTEPVNPFDTRIFSFLAGSAQLEGSTITEGDTRELILNNVYPDKPAKDIQMVKNLNEALKFILENKDEDITSDRIKEVNKLIMFSLHANAGKYKVVQNKIQGNPSFKTAKPEEVPVLMQEYCKVISSIDSKEDCLDRLGHLHNQLQRIHPFSDGNSRTTRMVLNWILLKHELPLVVIKMGSFDEYMSLTKLSKSRDDSGLNDLFLELIVHESLD